MTDTLPSGAKPEEPDAAPRKVSVPLRCGDGVFTRDEHVRVDAENAAQWDERRWRDKP